MYNGDGVTKVRGREGEGKRRIEWESGMGGSQGETGFSDWSEIECETAKRTVSLLGW